MRENKDINPLGDYIIQVLIAMEMKVNYEDCRIITDRTRPLPR